MLMITPDVRGHQPHHVRTQVAIVPRPEREVEMVRQQTVSQQTDIDPFAGFAEELAEGREVAILAENRAATITAIEDVVTVAAQSVACTAWHGGIMGSGTCGRQEKSTLSPFALQEKSTLSPFALLKSSTLLTTVKNSRRSRRCCSA